MMIIEESSEGDLSFVFRGDTASALGFDMGA